MTTLVLAALGCGGQQAPVPVRGPASAVTQLAGRWSGDYHSALTGRNGTISFQLSAQGDSAFGEVVMMPAGRSQALRPWSDPNVPRSQATSEVLTIRFVRVTGDQVRGRLLPYADPETGTRLLTAFEGKLVADTISGSFTTEPLAQGGGPTGFWRVMRY
jgi:hypothetical protein